MDEKPAGLVLEILKENNVGTLEAKLRSTSPQHWQQLVSFAQQEAIAPFLYQKFRKLGLEECLPSTVAIELQGLYHGAILRNAQLYHALGKVLKTLEQEHIDTILLKGSHLAELVYGNIALRTMGDVDILVRSKDLERTREVFLELGYGKREGRPDIQELRKHRHHLVGFRTHEGLNLEVHWTIVKPSSPYHVDLEGLWERSRELTLAKRKARVLSPEDLLLHLFLHEAYHDNFSKGIRALLDISMVCSHYTEELDWKVLEELAHRWGVWNCSTLCLSLSQDFLEPGIPVPILEKVRKSPLLAYLSRLISSHIFREQHLRGRPGFSPRQRVLWKLGLLDSFSDRLRYLVAVLSPVKQRKVKAGHW